MLFLKLWFSLLRPMDPAVVFNQDSFFPLDPALSLQTCVEQCGSLSLLRCCHSASFIVGYSSHALVERLFISSSTFL